MVILLQVRQFLSEMEDFSTNLLHRPLLKHTRTHLTFIVSSTQVTSNVILQF